MKSKNYLLAAISSLFISATVYAGTCQLDVTRTACPGKEEISFKKCDGEASCSEFHEVASSAECATLAVNACENKRLDITKSKVIKASFDEKPLSTPAGKDDFCTEYKNLATEFNQCS